MKVAVVWRLLIASVGGFNTMTGTDLLGAAAGGDAALAAPPAAHFFDTSTLRPDETLLVLALAFAAVMALLASVLGHDCIVQYLSTR